MLHEKVDFFDFFQIIEIFMDEKFDKKIKILLRSVGTDEVMDLTGNAKLREYMEYGTEIMRDKSWKPRTKYQYRTMNVHWKAFLIETDTDHREGVLQTDLAGGLLMNALLVAYIAFLIKTKGFEPSTFRGRVAAAIGVQRMALHSFFQVSQTWSFVKKLETHERKCKDWLSTEELRRLNQYIWTTANIGNQFYFACKMVWMLTTELVYRTGSIIPENHSNGAEFCSFCMSRIATAEKEGLDPAFCLNIQEKTKQGPWRLLYTKKRTKKVITLRLQKGGTFEAIRQYILVTKKNKFRPDCVLGVTKGFIDGGERRKQYSGKEALNYSRYVSWLKKCCKAADIYIGRQSYRKNRLPGIGDIRRSIMRAYGEYVGKDKLQYYVGHGSRNTAEQFYLGFNDTEMALVVGSVPWRITEGV